MYRANILKFDVNEGLFVRSVVFFVFFMAQHAGSVLLLHLGAFQLLKYLRLTVILQKRVYLSNKLCPVLFL